MARAITAAEDLSGTIASAVSGAMSIGGFFYHTTAATSGYPSDVDRWITIGLIDEFVIRRNWNGATHGRAYVNATAGGDVQAGGVTTGVWEHWMATADGSTIRLYKDGAEVGNTAQLSGIGSVTAIKIGDTGAEDLDGRCAEIVWANRAFTAPEVAALAKGISPLAFLPSLIDYWNLIRGLTGVKGTTLTATGTSVIEHPRMFYGGRPWIARTPTAAAGNGAGPLVDSLRLKSKVGGALAA